MVRITESKKIVSAGLIIEDTKTGKILACHTTNWPTPDAYDIPKGNVEKGEFPLQAAVRELYEETGIWISPSKYKNIIFLGTQHFVPTLGTFDREKDISVFYLKMEIPPLATLKCRSFFSDEKGIKRPEVDGYLLVNKSNLSPFYRAFQTLMRTFLDRCS